ncbi:MAG: asparagine synthase C-terminal domain-containing protein [Actinobacteria bacterium]|nr:asparagine synthase C-terminal domain-containing protein [Actinomycetota bacterium]
MRTFLEGQNLLYSDRLSMAASIEMRVPFLDDEVADLALSLPENLLVRGLRGKYALRRAMDGGVPRPILLRRKAGFGAPVRRWMRSDLREMLGDVLSKDAIERRGWLNAATVARLRREHADGERDHTYRLWTLLGLELWARAFLDTGRTGSDALRPGARGGV